MRYNDILNMPDDFSRPIYLFRKDKKGFTEIFELSFKKEPTDKKEFELDLGVEEPLSRKEWLKLCDKKKFIGWSYLPYIGTDGRRF